MKRFFVLFCCFFTSFFLQAQIHEVGFFAGGSNYIGDIGPTDFVSPNKLAFGLLYKWNKSPRHSWRFSYVQSEITSNDMSSATNGRKQRGYRFDNSIKEVSLGLEFNFFDFNLHDSETKFTPYIYSGISYIAYDELFVELGETKKDYTDSAIAIPMVVGIKSNITPHLILGAEIGARYSLTDNLDGSNPKNKNLEPLQFGNINNTDWYVFSGITLTYTFGTKPCYCAE
jgi:hypothetical protein